MFMRGHHTISTRLHRLYCLYEGFGIEVEALRTQTHSQAWPCTHTTWFSCAYVCISAVYVHCVIGSFWSTFRHALVFLPYGLKCPISRTFVMAKSSTWLFLRQLVDFVVCSLAIVVFAIVIVLSVAYHWEVKWPYKIVTSLLLLRVFRQVFLQVQHCEIRV